MKTIIIRHILQTSPKAMGILSRKIKFIFPITHNNRDVITHPKSHNILSIKIYSKKKKKIQ